MKGLYGTRKWTDVAVSWWCLVLVAVAFLQVSSAWLPCPTPIFSKASASRCIQHNSPSLVGLRMIQDDESSPSHESSSEEDEASTSSSRAAHNVTREVLKKIRVAKAQAEIDRILQGPDPPIDTQAELEKVIGISHLPPSEHPQLDAETAQLESELYQAVKQQDFHLASRKQEELLGRKLQQQEGMGVDDGGAILQVNAAFYRAFSQKSWKDMEGVWLRHDGDTSVCIHPSHKPLVGARRISKSWKQMFASTDGSFQRNWMEPHQIRIMLQGANMAIVTCEEHVFARRFVRGKKRRTELINKLLATNIFRKVNQQWYMCYHHASWHPESEAAKRALSGGDRSGGKVVSTSEFKTSSSLAATLAAQRRRRRRQLEDQDDEDEDTVGLSGIFGNDFGPILGDGKAKNQNGEGKPTRRIIMGGSLSDIINGGLGGLLGGDGNGVNGGGKNNGLPEGAIIQFSPMQDDDEEEDEEEDDSDDDENDDVHDPDDNDDDDDDDEMSLNQPDDIDDEDHEGESVAIIKEWAKSSQTSRRSSGRSPKKDHARQFETSSANNSYADKKSGKLFKDALRQNCISALRKLSEQGRIAPQQKRVLLTDIISCSSKGEFSMVEVAYELLCGEGESNEKDMAEDEFAEQCRVFAHELLLKQDS